MGPFVVRLCRKMALSVNTATIKEISFQIISETESESVGRFDAVTKIIFFLEYWINLRRDALGHRVHYRSNNL